MMLLHQPLAFIFFKKKLIYIFERKRERERNRSLICLFIPQMVTMVEQSQAETRSPECWPGLLWVARAQVLEPSYAAFSDTLVGI